MSGAAGSRPHALFHKKFTGQPVRRDSFDINDPRAQVFRPLQHGIAFVDRYLDVFDDWRNLIKRKGEQHELNANCRTVLATILRKCINFKTGLCEPSLDALMRLTKLSRATIVRCLKQLNAHGFIDWIRRTERTGNAPGEGPQVRQVSNAYFFDMARLPERCFKWLKEKLRRKGKTFDPPRYPPKPYVSLRERRALSARTRRDNLAAALAAAKTPGERAAALYPGQPEQQREYIEMATPSLAGAASSETGLNPPSTIKINKEWGG
ncbi:hypothetical protein [Aurantiacibacter suaedae]|uniref:hypothetical protein n=1 Tax=Aurantiacibacter suaedae TaxID=2545755 RepID=UPI0010F48B58|nr:hypothetical protein [Aurantiacibacter suaedae]